MSFKSTAGIPFQKPHLYPLVTKPDDTQSAGCTPELYCLFSITPANLEEMD
jgi:hypothetical protein